MSKTKNEQDTIEEFTESFSWPIVELAQAIDSLAFAIAAQPAVDPSRLARQLEREARWLNPKNELAKALLERMVRSVRKVAKKRASRGRRKSSS